MRRLVLVRALMIVFLLLCARASCFAQAVAGAESRGAVLICSSNGTWSGTVDLDWLREVHDAGFEVDWLDNHTDFTWDRIRRFNCIVIYGCPPANPDHGYCFPARGPRRKEFISLVERYLEAGGGVFCMVYTHNGDEGARPMIEPWGARLPLERLREEDDARVEEFPRMRGREAAFRIEGVLPSPISTGVRTLWWPLTDAYNTSWTAPIVVSGDWQVVVRGNVTSRTVPVDLEKSAMPGPPDPLVRPEGVKQPDLLAIREWKAGRILLVSQWPQFSIGQGTQWFYNRRCLSRGFQDAASDYERLILNAFDWLCAPSLKNGNVGEYETDPARLVYPNLRPEVRKRYEEHFWSDKELNLHRPPRGGRIFRGLLGARSELSSGKGDVEGWAEAARAAGLDFLVFFEEFSTLTPQKLAALAAACAKHSDEKLLLMPGYTIGTNTGNHLFIYGVEALPWPPDECLTGLGDKLLNIQYQDDEGKYHLRPVVLTWLLSKARKHQVGYYNFDDPRAMQMKDLRCYSAAAIRFYRDGKLVEDRTDDYLTTAQCTLPPTPVSVSLMRSPAAVAREIEAGNALTHARAWRLGTLFRDALRWSHQYDGMNVFPSDGPIIRAWPECYRVNVYGAEPFVAGRALMPSEMHVASEAGLKELRIYNGRGLFRRFLPNGAKEFRHILQLPGNVQRNLVLIAEDVRGGKAVSFARRCWKDGAMAVVFCGDHVNDCGRGYLAHGPGMFQTQRFPEIFGGHTWDGGPKGVMPVGQFRFNDPVLVSDRGAEGRRRFNNTPVLEFSDDQVVCVRSICREVFPEPVPAVNAWHTYGPIEPSRLFEHVRRYVEFNRPSTGVQPVGWPAIPVRRGATVTCFENTLTFKQDQQVKDMTLISTGWIDTKPLMLAVQDGSSCRVYDLAREKHQLRILIEAGQWFGLYSPKPSNAALLMNRGEPIVLIAPPMRRAVRLWIKADLAGQKVKAGESRHYEVFAVNDPLDAKRRGPERFFQIADYLSAPDGVKLTQGKRMKTPGFFDVKSEDYVVELEVPRPPDAIGLTLPLRVHGLNSRWSAGLLQIEGYTTGYYTNGENVYTSLGLDLNDIAYAAIFPDMAERTRARVGHPVVCDRPDVFIEVMPRPGPDGGYLWYVAANNPTDRALDVTFRQAMKVPGLKFQDRSVKIPAGGYTVLQRQ